MTEREALKLALEHFETWTHEDSIFAGEFDKEITAIKEALAQPEQEPVAWGVDWGKAGDIPCVSIIKRLPDGGIKVMAVEYAPYSYTSPPQRTWVGLTFADMEDLAVSKEWLAGARWAEAKLKEKNT